MTQRQMRAEQAKQTARNAADEARPGIEWLGRLGYAAKGVVYALVGILAGQAALGRGGATTGTEGVLERILQAPFGRALLGVTALGLVGHAIWRFTQAGMDTENKGTDAKGVVTRAAYTIIGLIYIGLALSALRLALGSGGGNGDDTAGRTAWLLGQPLGRWLVGLLGLTVVAVGLFQLYRAYRAEFREHLRMSEMSAAQERWATATGRLGYAARGIVFGIIGGFLIVAGLQSQPEAARGLGGALDTLARQPQGKWLLGIVAAGLIAYGIFMLVQARYRRMLIR